MAVPEELLPQIAQVDGAIEGVIAAVDDARYDRRTDEPGSGLRVEQVLAAAELATERWFKVSDDLEEALDVAIPRYPESEGEIRACQSALMLLNQGVAQEVALLQPLETLPGNSMLEGASGRPPQTESSLREAALGSGELVRKLTEGTDDDAAREPAGQIDSEDEVHRTVRVILDRSADAIEGVIAGLAAGPLVGASPIHPPAAVREMLEQFGEWAIEDGIDKIPGRVTRLVRWALSRVKRLLTKILGNYRDIVIRASDRLLEESTSKDGEPLNLVAQVMGHLYGSGSVVDRGVAAFQTAHRSFERTLRARRLRKLQKSNERWVAPVEILARGIGPLWAVLIPVGVPVPAAPVAAAVLLAWTVLLSGDQLDSDRHFPNFWKGVVRRSGGD